MDITPYVEMKTAPRALVDSLPERSARVRFMLPTPDGDWRAVTWAAFGRQMRNIALYLSSVGLKSGDRAAIFSPNRVEWMSAALAIQAAGGAMVPVYPASTVEQAAYIVRHSDAKVLFVDTPALLGRLLENWEALEAVVKIVLLDDALDAARVLADLRAKGKSVPSYVEVEKRLITWGRAFTIGAARDQEDPNAFETTLSGVSLDQPGLMLYTSGTSGAPKGVPLTHRNVGSNGLDWIKCNAPLLDDAPVDVMWLPMSHIFGLGEVCLGNTLGFTTYFSDPANVIAKLPEVHPSVFMSVPAYWEKLAMAAMTEDTPERRREKLQRITGGRFKFCLSGGAGLKREVKEFFYECGILITEGYGLTETSPTLTLNRMDAFRFDSVGKPLPSVQLKLASDGEILAKGPNVFSGYHKDPVATKEIFTEDGWLKTGDVGRFTDDGFLQIIDRKKDILVTSGGKNVPPANIEIRFADEPLIAQVVVYGDGHPYLVAGVWMNQAAADAQLSEIPADTRPDAMRALVQKRIDQVNSTLASYETIKKFRIMDRPLTVEGGMLTSTLKVRRKAVYKAFHDDFEGLYR
jgi:long-chain acyl-CoA synthetase